MAREGAWIERSVAERFAAIAAIYPERLAVRGDRVAFTYAELLLRGRAVARSLALHPRAARVALLCDHDAPLVAAMLGALLAGRAFVPLDPTHPPARLAQLLADADTGALLADDANLSLATALAGDRLPLAAWDAAPLADDAPIDPDAVAYLLYTSGSTGEPKGVCQSQRNLLHHIRAYTLGAGIAAGDQLTLLSSYAVDAALMDIFGALLLGGALHLWDLRRRGTDGLAAFLGERAISVWHSTPTVFRHFLAQLDPDAAFPRVRRVVLGGEEARGEDLAAFARRFGPASVLVNGLGPTESTTALQAFFRPGDPIPVGPLPVGRPVLGTEILLLDERDGAGEIAIVSEHLALGYFRRPELTARAFSPDPRGGPGRLYRSGDLGRRLPDGQIAFLGRVDLQIKLRGHRVELGEIEAALRGDPAVEEAVVTARALGSFEVVLVAHVLTRALAPWDPARLTARLRAILPAPLVPARLERLQALPRTASGKLDRRAIAALRLPPAPPGGEGRGGATEAWLIAAFAQLLAVDDVGPHSDFFALGGHSLAAVRLLSRIRAELGLALAPEIVFDHPSPTALAAHLDAALAVRAPEPWSPILPLPREGELPLSFAEERLCFFERLHPGSPAYHVPALLRLRGPVDPTSLAARIAAIVSRHEALRTSFPCVNGQPRRQIAPSITVPIEPLSLVHLTAAARWSAALALATARAREPFDLERGPLLRAALIALDAADHLLVLVFHHLAADGWSVRLLVAQLAPAGLSRRGEIDYADHAAWQRAALTDERLASLLSYWRERLAGLPALGLATARPRPAVPSRCGALHAFIVPPTLAARLGALGREAGVTLHMIALASYALLLAGASGQRDVAVATPVAGRERAEAEPLVGTFVDTVVLRVDLSGDPTARALLARVRAVALGAHAHAGLPFERLVAALAGERDPARPALFEAMLLVHNTPPPHLDAGMELVPVDLDLGTALCDLTLSLRETDAGLAACFEYATDLFDAAAVARLEERWLALLAGLVDAPDRPIRALPSVGPCERRLLVELASTPRAPAPRVPILARIAAQARRAPDAIAVVHEGEAISYGELVRSASARAAELVAAGVGRGSLVPIVCPRGIAIVVAMLAILETGAAFVPLDPAWPAARLDDALARIGEPVPRSSPGPDPEDPIYAIFTSGTTGSPRLALIPHRGIENRFDWMDEAFGAAPPVTLQTTAPIYDSAVWQLLWPLTRGGTAVIPPDASALSAADIARLVERHRITILDFVPSVFAIAVHGLVAAAPELASLRHLILGGEAIDRAATARFQAVLPGVRVTNLYGPTEASIGCVAAIVDASCEGPIPIGRPIPGVHAALLDEGGRLVPLGAVGEIHLGGAAVGLGYHGDEVATRAAFLPCPVPELGTGTLYRTGDLARLREDGSLEYLGRRDDQLKIRGVRVDPREIEAVLRSHPAIAEAAVVAAPGALGQTQLHAHVAPAPLPADLASFVRARLPAALVPSRFAVHASLPRAASGKLDRRALAALPVPASAGGVPPASDLEKRIAAIWSEVLGAPAPPADASFFEVGGHSLAALAVHHLLEQQIERALPLVDLFRYPTIRALAAHLADASASLPAPPDPPARSAALRRQRDRRQPK